MCLWLPYRVLLCVYVCVLCVHDCALLTPPFSYISGENGTGLYSPFVFTLDLSSPTAAWTALPAALCPEPRADFIALPLNTTTVRGTCISCAYTH